MLKNIATQLIIFVLLTITLIGPATAQPAETRPSEVNVSETVAAPKKPDLKRVFAKETIENSTQPAIADVKAMEKERLRQPQKKGWSKGEKTILVVFIVALAIGIPLLIKYGKDCDYEPAGCSPSDDNCRCVARQTP